MLVLRVTLIGKVSNLNAFLFFVQAEDGKRDVERSRGLGDVYKRQDYQGICHP